MGQKVITSLHILKKRYTPMSLIENTSQETRGIKGSLNRNQKRTQNTLGSTWRAIFELS